MFNDCRSIPVLTIAALVVSVSSSIARKVTKLLFIVFLNCIVSSSVQAQYFPDVSANKVLREETALSLIRISLSAMNPTQAPPLNDLTNDWKVIKWAGKDQSGLLHEEAIGSSYRLSRMVLDDGLKVDNWHVMASGYEQTPSGQRTFGDERNLQTLAFVPALLLEELIANPLDSVQSIPATNNTDSCVRATIREASWMPQRGRNGSTQISLCFDSQSHFVARVLLRERYDGDPQHTRSVEIDFENYKSVNAWILPHTKTVRSASQVILELVALSGSINSGLVPSPMPNNN